MEQIFYQRVVSAAKYYVGIPDGQFFTSKDFGDDVVCAKKAYVTLNTLMGGKTSELDRFVEGKKQVPGLITEVGVEKIIDLFAHLYVYAKKMNRLSEYETVRAARQSEVTEGSSVVEALTSTTKLSINEIMKLGYGDKNNLAICSYKFNEGAVVFDMESLGTDYPKPEEKEVLLMMGNQLHTRCIGYDENYLGKDGLPALMYEITVDSPKAVDIPIKTEDLEKIVYNRESLNRIREFYNALNSAETFPEVPECYREWKSSFKKLAMKKIQQ